MMFYLDQATDKRYYLNKPFIYAERQYTKAGANAETFAALGFVKVIPEPRPSDQFYIVEPMANDGTYGKTPRNLKEVKAELSARQLKTAHSILQQSDFVFIRMAEEGAGTVTVPTVLPTQRDQVRAVCTSNIEQINGCKSISALEQLVPNLQPYPHIDVEKYLTLETL